MDRKITLLQADKPLTKKFYPKDKDGYTVDTYPGVLRFSSIEVTPIHFQDFFETLVEASTAGMCILKGNLTREITDEPRRGLTQPHEPTHWLCLDYDSSEGFNGPDELLHHIDPALDEVSFAFQHSASAGITKPAGVRGHIFLWLAREITPPVLKQWLIKLNMSLPKLKEQTYLARNGLSLIYPLDITTCQNDKLIYLATPSCIGFADPLPERWIHVPRAKAVYELEPQISREKNTAAVNARIAELRDTAGLPKRKPKMESKDDQDILLNPDRCVISVVKDEGEFVRCNLNGGDSGAYWYWKRNPDILHNFKGEPEVYLKDIAPDFYEGLTGGRAGGAALRHFVLRDKVTDSYYTAACDSDSHELVEMYEVSSKVKCQDYCTQHGVARPRTIDTWVVEFNPAATTVVDFDGRRVNTFRPTRYLNVEGEPGPWPTIEKVLRHITVDEPTYQHLLNWLAFIYQKRQKSQTAWIFQGTYGTGKGTLFTEILTPIFGEDPQSATIGQEQFEDKFNGYLRNNLILFVDESNIDNARQSDKVMEFLNRVITEPTIPIRSMNTNLVQAKSYSNVIVATNKLGIKLKKGDRRWNVAPSQSEPIDIIRDRPLIKEELMDFARFLRDWQVDELKARKPLKSKARELLIEVSTTLSEQFFDEFKRGDLLNLAEQCFHTPDVMHVVEHDRFKQIVAGWLQHLGRPQSITSQDLKAVYEYYVRGESKKALTDPAWGWLLKKNQIHTTRKKINGKLVAVLDREVVFQDPTGELEGIELKPTAKVISMKVGSH